MGLPEIAEALSSRPACLLKASLAIFKTMSPPMSVNANNPPTKIIMPIKPAKIFENIFPLRLLM